MAAKQFNFAGFVLRLIAALALVFSTYNPEKPYSYFYWAFKTAGRRCCYFYSVQGLYRSGSHHRLVDLLARHLPIARSNRYHSRHCVFYHVVMVGGRLGLDSCGQCSHRFISGSRRFVRCAGGRYFLVPYTPANDRSARC